MYFNECYDLFIDNFIDKIVLISIFLSATVLKNAWPGGRPGQEDYNFKGSPSNLK